MEGKITLASLNQGEEAIVYELTSVGDIRRRLQDIGLTPGTKVKCIHESALGDPVAYLIRGAVIALRKEDSSHIILR